MRYGSISLGRSPIIQIELKDGGDKGDGLSLSSRPSEHAIQPQEKKKGLATYNSRSRGGMDYS